MKSHKVKTETINMILCCPVNNRFYDILSNHWTLSSCFVTTAWTIWEATVFVLSIIVVREWLIEVRIICSCCVIINNIHNNSDTTLMKWLNHLLELVDSYFTVVRVCWIRAFWEVVVFRVIAPVVLSLIKLCFINAWKVKCRHNLNVCNSEILKIIKASRITIWILCTCFCKCKILTLMSVRNAWTCINREISYMLLINNSVCCITAKLWTNIAIPTIWVCRLEVDNHTSVAVYATCSCIKVNSLVFAAINLECISVVYAIEVACFFCCPDALIAKCHINRFDKCVAIACWVEVKCNFLCERWPCLKCCFFCCVVSTEVVAVISILLLELICIINSSSRNIKLNKAINVELIALAIRKLIRSYQATILAICCNRSYCISISFGILNSYIACLEVCFLRKCEVNLACRNHLCLLDSWRCKFSLCVAKLRLSLKNINIYFSILSLSCFDEAVTVCILRFPLTLTDNEAYFVNTSYIHVELGYCTKAIAWCEILLTSVLAICPNPDIPIIIIRIASLVVNSNFEVICRCNWRYNKYCCNHHKWQK